jgi:hypothetical protein
MKKSIKLALVSLGIAAAPLGAANAALIYYGTSAYELTSVVGTWAEAQAEALGNGGNLVTINDAAEEAWLQAAFALPNLWIGYHQLDTSVEPSGNWIWASGQASSYINWAGGEPNDSDSSIENWAVMNWGGVGNGWNDLPDSGPGWSPTLGIIEYDNVPEPGVLGLFGLGLLGFGVAARRKRKNR